MTFLALFLIGCIHTNTLTMDAIVFTGPQAATQADGLSNIEILDQAILRRSRGDLIGARNYLNLILDQGYTSPEYADAIYQTGITYEMEENFEKALFHYDILVENFPESVVAKDGWFRRALCLEYLGQHKNALKSIKHVKGELDTKDHLLLDFQKGISKIRAGRTRSGVKILIATLSESEQIDGLTYFKAKSHITIARLWLDEAKKYDFQGSQKKQAENLNIRADYIQKANKEVVAATNLKEPEWILEGLLLLGDGYHELYQDLISSKPNKKVQEDVYRELLYQQADILLIKAWNHYDQGVSLAGRLLYVGRPVDQLKMSRDALNLRQPIEQVKEPENFDLQTTEADEEPTIYGIQDPF